MSSDVLSPRPCPKCESGQTMVTADGNGLCFECRYEWDPAIVAVPPLAPPAPFGMASTEEVFGSGDVDSDSPALVMQDDASLTPASVGAVCDFCGRPLHPYGQSNDVTVCAFRDDADHVAYRKSLHVPAEVAEGADDEAENLLESMKGTWVVLEGGQQASIVSFEDGDWCVVRLMDGREERVSVNDIERAVASKDDVAEVFEAIPDDVAHEFTQAVTLCAGMILKAGIASTRQTGDGIELVQPPFGYLPDTDDAMPLVEQAAAFAVATLIQAFGIDGEQLAGVLDGWEALSKQGNLQTEETDDTDTSNNE